MSAPQSNSALVLELAEEFLDRYRRGERPSLKEYVDRYPLLGAEIREVFPAMAMMENIALADGSLAGEALPGGGHPPAALPQRLGDYRIIREVGHGGMGVVYEAEQVSLGRHVALKVLPKSLLPDARAKQRFEREAKAAAKLHHTNIVPVFGVGEQDGMPYYVMQFIQGLGLDEVLDELKKLQCAGATTGPFAGGEVRGSRRELSAVQVARSLLTGEFQGTNDQDGAGEAVAPRDAAHQEDQGADAPRPPAFSDSFTRSSSSVVLPGRGRDGSQSKHRKPTYWQNVASIGVQVAEALEYAHKQGIKHRDIKPSNLLLDTQGTVWVTDFGLAKADDQQNLTHTGDILGTLRYMPPEAFEGRSDVRSDVYSLGLTLYELLAFRPAFAEKERNRLIKQVTHEEPARLRKLNRSVPRDLETIVHKASDREPGRRYQTAADLAADLQRFLNDEPIQARRVSAWRRAVLWARRRPAAAALLLVSGLAALALVGVGVALFFNVRLQEAFDEADRLRQAEAGARNQEAQARKQLEQLQYAHFIDRAHTGLRDGNLGQVEALLEACRVEQRHWEWQYLKRQRDTALRTFEGFYPAEAEVTLNWGTRAFSLDEARIAIANTDGTVKVCDATTGREMLTLQSPTARLLAVTFSPDGTRLASIGSDHTIRIWNATTRQEPVSLTGHTTKISCVFFSPDGRRLASTAWHEECVRIWDVATGQPLFPPLKAPTKSAKGFPGAVGNIAFSPDGARLASTIRDGSIYIWDVNTGRLIRTLQGDTFEIWGLAFSPDGTRLASGGHDHTVKIWDVDPGRAQGGDSPLLTFRDHSNWLTSVAFSPDGARVASASADGVIKIWMAATGEERVSLTTDAGVISKLAYSLDGARLISEANINSVGRGALKVWDTTTDPKARILARHQGQSFHGVLSPDGKRFAFSNFDSPDAKATVLDTTTGQVLHTLKGHSPNLHKIAFSPDGRRIATTGGDKTVKLWDAETGQEICTFDTGNREIHSAVIPSAVAFSPIGNRIAMTRSDNLVSLWDLTTDREVLQLKGHQDNIVNNTNSIVNITYSPDGRFIGTLGHGASVVRVWDAQTGKELHCLQGHASLIGGIAFSPDAKWLASASLDQTVKLWDVATGALLRTFKGHSFMVLSVAFTPDGKRLASAGQDGTVKIWDPALEAEALLTLHFHTGEAAQVTFSPDGGQLYLATGERVIQVFDARPLTPEITAEREALGLLEYLFTKPLCKADVIEHLRHSPTITAPARQLALELVERYHEETDPELYYQSSWALLRQTYLNRVQYDFALRQARTACERAPKNGRYQTALGVAQYRTGQYEAARTTLKQRDNGTPEVLAFLAMAQHRAGQHPDARTTLEQLLQTMNQPEWSRNAEALGFVREAEALLRGPAPEPKP
jgi:WD40 repeat protein/serine/threonine protein kinase